jgi:O-antigen ligase
MMANLRAPRVSIDGLAGLLMAALAAGLVIATTDIDVKYKLAIVVALGGSAILSTLPERRIICVILWVLITPLSVEKVFFVDAAEGPDFTDPTIIINASDGPLILLAIFLISDAIFTRRPTFRWSRLSTVQLILLIWSTLSFAIHATYLGDGFTASAPLALLRELRLLVFVLLIQSAIRSRGDVVVTLLAVAVAVAVQTTIVGLSYSTGQLFSYATLSLPSDAAKLQGFDSSGGGQLLRATGTVGQVNEQAIFHAVLTIPLIALFVARNPMVMRLSVILVASSSLALVLTFSRGAWLAFPVGLAVCGVFALRRRMIGRTAILVGAALSMGGAIALTVLAQPIYQRLAFGDTGATGARVRLNDLAIDLFQAYPLIGVGPGEFDEAALRIFPPGSAQDQWVEPGEQAVSTSIGRVEFMELRAGDFLIRRPLPVHNKFLLTLSELGLPGLLMWLWLYAEFIRASWRCSRLPDRFLSLFGIAGMGLAAAELSYMTVEHFQDEKPLKLALFIPAVMFATLRIARGDAQRASPDPAKS